MSGDIEFGSCSICGSSGQISRKYYNYDIKCECCSNKHFEIVYHCANCTPSPPKQITVTVKPVDDSLGLVGMKDLLYSFFNRIDDEQCIVIATSPSNAKKMHEELTKYAINALTETTEATKNYGYPNIPIIEEIPLDIVCKEEPKDYLDEDLKHLLKVEKHYRNIQFNKHQNASFRNLNTGHKANLGGGRKNQRTCKKVLRKRR